MQDSCLKNTYNLEIQYKNSYQNPAAIFSGISNIISSLHDFDKLLLKPLDKQIRLLTVRHNSESCTFNIGLASTVSFLADDTLYWLDWIPIFSSYLVQGKKSILKWCSSKNQIHGDHDLRPLVEELESIAAKLKINLLPGHKEITQPELLTGLRKLASVSNDFSRDVKAFFIDEFDRIEINPRFMFTGDMNR